MPELEEAVIIFGRELKRREREGKEAEIARLKERVKELERKPEEFQGNLEGTVDELKRVLDKLGGVTDSKGDYWMSDVLEKAKRNAERKYGKRAKKGGKTESTKLEEEKLPPFPSSIGEDTLSILTGKKYDPSTKFEGRFAKEMSLLSKLYAEANEAIRKNNFKKAVNLTKQLFKKGWNGFTEVLTARAAHIGLGIEYRKKGYYSKAEKQFEEAKGLAQEHSDPDYIRASFELALTFFDSNKVELALKELEEIVKLVPNHNEALFLLGSAYFRKKDWNNAETQFKRVIDLDSNNADPYYYLGEVYNNQNQIEKAIREYEKAFNLNPKSVQINTKLVNLYRYKTPQKGTKKPRPQAKALCDETVQDMEDKNKYTLEDNKKVVTKLRTAIQTDPDYACAYDLLIEVHTHLARFYAKQEKSP